MKKFVLVTLMLLTAGLMLFAGGGRQSPSSTSETTIRYLMPGDAPILYDEIITLVNEKLFAEKGIRIEIVYIPWDVWQQRVNLMLTTGDEFDIYHIMQDQIQMSAYQAMGGLTDITALLDQHGPNVKRVISSGAWDAMRIEGKIYGIPAQWAELSNDDGFSIRKDVLDKFGYGVPSTIDELINTAGAIAARWDGSGKLYLPAWGFTDFAKNPFARTYDTWPFIVKDYIALIRQNGTVDSWLESEEFKKNTAYMRKLNQAGLIHPDVLTLSADQGNNIYRSGNWFFTLGGIDSYIDDVRTNNNPNIRPEDYILIKMNPEKPDIYPVIVKNLNGISSTSKHPEAAIAFFDWLYAGKENYKLFMYGREGQEYTLDTRGLKIAAVNENNQSLYGQADWMLGNVNYMIPGSNALPMEVQYLYTFNPKAIASPGSDFFFNAAAVEAEWVNIQSEFRASIVPIYAGILPYDEAFPAALQRIKAAGLDKVLAEYRRQLTEHIASKAKR
ncbi:MAG: ABC transporter substrate-binding protein [Treponema sp.]|jgi:putative aldouronate transport system substrate-binding protein|nr:ABC transporter substrate-binding protein [Treponema sp.]